MVVSEYSVLLQLDSEWAIRDEPLVGLLVATTRRVKERWSCEQKPLKYWWEGHHLVDKGKFRFG